MLTSTDSFVTRNFKNKFPQKTRFWVKLEDEGPKDIIYQNFLDNLRAYFWRFWVGEIEILVFAWKERIRDVTVS